MKVFSNKNILTFLAITLFYFFESAQMSYFNVLAPYFLSHHIYNHSQISALSAAYYYGDVVGLLPVGFMLDKFPLRKILLFAILGSIIAAFCLFLFSNMYSQWLSRFLCGFFGGTFSFIGGIRIISALFSKRFTLFIGLFLSAGMLGGLICQYPLLLIVSHFGPQAGMLAMACFGLLVIIINLLFLYPIDQNVFKNAVVTKNKVNIFNTIFMIMKNTRNW
jgi:MFS family permease